MQQLINIKSYLFSIYIADKINDKESFFKLKSYYQKALFYQFELNNRDDFFKKTLYRVNFLSFI